MWSGRSENVLSNFDFDRDPVIQNVSWWIMQAGLYGNPCRWEFYFLEGERTLIFSGRRGWRFDSNK